MRFFTLALPLLFSALVTASPIAVEERTTKPNTGTSSGGLSLGVGLDANVGANLAKTLLDLKVGIAEKAAYIEQNLPDKEAVGSSLGAIGGLLDGAIKVVVDAGVNVDLGSAGSGGKGLLGAILPGGGSKKGGLLGSLLGGGKGDDVNLIPVKDALNDVLYTLKAVVERIPDGTKEDPIVRDPLAAIEPKIYSLTSGLDRLIPGLLKTVNGVLLSVKHLLIKL